MSKHRPYASKVFANEALHGAPQLRSFLANDLRAHQVAPQQGRPTR